jgi:protein-disulfide isomerase
VLLSGATGAAIATAAAPAPPTAIPAGVTAAGGIVVGRADAPHTVIAYEDPQCPICGEFEKTSGAVLAQAVAAGQVKVEYRMRSFLGPESVRAVAALGAAQDAGKFEELRAALFAHQPQEGTGGFTVADLRSLGASVGLTEAQFVQAVREQTYTAWARQIDDVASRDGNTGTPELLLDGKALDSKVVFDPEALAAALESK